MLGSLYYGGQGVSRNLEYSATLFQQSCTAGFTRGCGQLGESYLFGEGVPKDIIKARQILESACDAGYGPGCFNVGIMHRQGIETPKNEPLAQARFRQGCDLGYGKACQALAHAGTVLCQVEGLRTVSTAMCGVKRPRDDIFGMAWTRLQAKTPATFVAGVFGLPSSQVRS